MIDGGITNRKYKETSDIKCVDLKGFQYFLYRNFKDK